MTDEQLKNKLSRIHDLAKKQYKMKPKQARELIRAITAVFKELLLRDGYAPRDITRLTTKFRDAGRRSAPWKAASSRVPGRPQDGSDGNRINRWLMAKNHKFYADEVTATLVEVKYYLQALSMKDAPRLPPNSIQNCFDWLLEQPLQSGNYLDPIQFIPMSLRDIFSDFRSIQSGHFHPLDRGGRHMPKNSFLMLARSNQLQGNLTVEELMQLMKEILERQEQHANGA